MVIRVAREDFGPIDPLAVGSTASGGLVYDDGTTSGPWMDRPWKGKEDYVVSEAMRQAIIPRDVIAAIRPPVPYQLLPAEYGYYHRAVTIEEVLDTDRWAPQRRSWVSPTVRPMTRRDLEEQNWSGTERNVNSSPTPFG